jgi:hypothetical protein
MFYNHILSSKAELLWKTDREAVKTKCVPRFSAWVKVLDPCHRSLWRALDFDTTVNHFRNYDMYKIIPCPDTWANSLTDQAYAEMAQRIRELI